MMVIPSGCYVYELVDPRDGAVFYVGKGTGKRAWQHQREAYTGQGSNKAKRDRILDVNTAGLEIVVRIVKEGMTDLDAFDLERSMIAEKRAVLTNVADGGYPARIAVDPERTLLETMIRLSGDLEAFQNNRRGAPASDAEIAVAQVFKSAVQAWERLTGQSFAGDGCELEWSI